MSLWRPFSAILALLLGPIALCVAAAENQFRVAAIVNGDTLTLDDGRRVRLVGIDAPRPPLGLAADVPWRLAEAAKAALAEIAQDRAITLRYDGAIG